VRRFYYFKIFIIREMFKIDGSVIGRKLVYVGLNYVSKLDNKVNSNLDVFNKECLVFSNRLFKNVSCVLFLPFSFL
jgi:hypothetical protein